MQWSKLAWLKKIPAEDGADLVNTIIHDLEIILAEFIKARKSKKPKEVKEASSKTDTK
jgi:hypothetical protein